MLHLDEARRQAVAALQQILEGSPKGSKAVLIDDLFGRLRVVLWAGEKSREALKAKVDQQLQQESGHYWTGEIWLATGGSEASDADQRLYARSWDEAQPTTDLRLRVLDRHRNRGAWMQHVSTPLWEMKLGEGGPAEPPLIVFYSFKGGVGRSTALASFAIQRARAGERVVAIDADLDAPGLGNLLSAEGGDTAPWGVVDYLLERPLGEVDLRDYYHACRREAVTGAGEILVFPTGKVNGDYLGKLARIDFEPPAQTLKQLLHDIRDTLRPRWILLDARAGLADPAGVLLGGLAHLHVLFGTFAEQSWAGLRLVVDRLGGERVRNGLPQADCLLVQAMVPENTEIAERSRLAFSERAQDEFVDGYYAEDPASPGEGDDLWTVGDASSSDAPHVAVPLSYSSRLADFRAIDVVADYLADSPEYRRLAGRILAHFGAPG